MHFQECLPSELSLFSSIPVNTGTLKSELQTFLPITTLDNSSVIEFKIPGTNDLYKDLSSIFLSLKVQFLKEDNSKYDDKKMVNDSEGKKIQLDPETSQPTLVSNALFSMFKSCAVYLNNKQV